VSKLRLLLITGLPGTGKTTLARELARRYAIALIAKDTIKESLLDAFASGGSRSRGLSDASFAIQLTMAAQLLGDGVDLILEGNFRALEHAPRVLSILPQRSLRLVQVLCRLGEPERQARIAARQSDPTRHPGHERAPQLGRVPDCDAFLDLPGERRLFDGGGAEAALGELMASLDALWSKGLRSVRGRSGLPPYAGPARG
jgi:predicted kinase